MFYLYLRWEYFIDAEDELAYFFRAYAYATFIAIYDWMDGNLRDFVSGATCD